MLWQKSRMQFPFRFYGRAPADWLEGANGGHRFEVKFVEPPELDQRRRMTTRFEQRLAGGPAESTGGAWLWSGRFARFDVGERWPGASLAAFGRVADVLVEIHREVAPIAQVIFMGARDRGNGAWDRASVEAQPVPDPGPSYDPPLDLQVSAYPRPTDPALSIAAPDPEVEAHRSELLATLAAARTKAKLAKASQKMPMSPFSVERVRAYEAELPRLRPDELARFQIPEPTHEMRTPPWGGQPYRAYRDGDLPIEHLTSVPCAYRMYADSPRGLAYLDRQGVRREVTGLPEQSCSTFWDANNTIGPWVRDDGETLWFALGLGLYEARVADGVARTIYKALARIKDLALLSDGCCVIATGKALVVVDPRNWSIRAQQKSSATKLQTVLGGCPAARQRYLRQEAARGVGLSRGCPREAALLHGAAHAAARDRWCHRLLRRPRYIRFARRARGRLRRVEGEEGQGQASPTSHEVAPASSRSRTHRTCSRDDTWVGVAHPERVESRRHSIEVARCHHNAIQGSGRIEQ